MIKEQIETTIDELYKDSKYDHIKMVKSFAKGILGPMRPVHFKDVYLSISQDQGRELVNLIKANNIKNIVEFGTSFGISTLFLAQGASETNGTVITTELIKSKAKTAIENFKKAGVDHLINLRVGDAMETLHDHQKPIDLLLLDGWKNLYLPLFRMLESNYHSDTIIYVDNADMGETQQFLRTINHDDRYRLKSIFDGKVVLITLSRV